MKELNQNTLNFIEQFEALQAWADKLNADLTEERFNQKPSSESWSVGECLQHINITAEQYLPEVINTVQIAKENNLFSDVIFKPRFIQNKLITFLEPPYKRKIKTFKIFNPTSNLDIDATFDKFKMLNDLLIRIERSKFK